VVLAAVFVLGVLLVCGVGGGVAYYLHKRGPAAAASPSASVAATRTFTSRDGIVAMIAPSGWKPIGGDDLSPAVDLGVCSAAEDVLVFNVNEAASDFEDDFTVAAYAEIVQKLYRENMKATFRNAEPIELAGYPALRFPFEGSYSGIRLRGFLFALKSPRNFHHVVLATVPSDYARLIGSGMAVVASTKITVPPTSNAAPTATAL
jgi:uncharacterized membrane protein